MTVMQIADTATVAIPDFEVLEITLGCVKLLEEIAILYA